MVFGMRVLAVGDNCIDYYSELGKRFPGGNALNMAVYASRLDFIEADYIGIIGTDDNGKYMLSQIEAQGLNIENIIIKEGKTAVTEILIRDGERIFADYVEGVQTDSVLSYEAIPIPESYDLIHFTIWGFGREHVKTLKEKKHILLSCDFSSQLEDPRTEIMPYLDFSFFSGNHLLERCEDPEPVLRKLKEKTSGLVVMTLGEYGSMSYDGDKFYRGKALPVDVVDSLGAGDAFIAEFLCSRIIGKTIQKSIEAGHCAATEICKRLGAWGGES
jgi:fructoselysine 6-kinase